MKGNMEGKGPCLNTGKANMGKKVEVILWRPIGQKQDQWMAGESYRETDDQPIQRGKNLATETG